MDERDAASRLRGNAKRHLAVQLNVAQAFFVDGNMGRVQMNQLADLKETFIDACNRYTETFAGDDLTEGSVTS